MDLKTLADFMSQDIDCKIVFLRHLGRQRVWQGYCTTLVVPSAFRFA